MKSKSPFSRISCGDCYFVTKPLRCCQYKVTQKFVCGTGWGGYSTLYHSQLTWSLDCLPHALQLIQFTWENRFYCNKPSGVMMCCVWGKMTSFTEVRSFSFFFLVKFILHRLQVPSKCEPAETSQGKISLSSRRCGRKEWRERVEAVFLFFNSYFKKNTPFFKIWSKIYGCVCLCDVRVKNSLLFREINSKCLAGAGGVTGMAAAQRMQVCVCWVYKWVCMYLRFCVRCSTNGFSAELWMFYRLGWCKVKRLSCIKYQKWVLGILWPECWIDCCLSYII